MARNEAIPLPAGMDPEKATFARLMGVTWSSLTLTNVRPPAKVLVAGLGAVGLFGALIFQNSGYDVFAYDPLQSRRDAALLVGVHHVLPAAPLNDPQICGKVSLFLECSAHEQALLDGLQLIKRGGEVILVGVPMVRRTDVYAQEVLNKIFRKCAIVRSGSEFQVSLKPADFRTNSILENQEMALQWIAEGKINVDPLYTIENPEKPQEIYQAVLNRTMEKLAIVFDWQKYI
jgi:threonine dehydrogenase-like Zn-dependent dehydrogenase